jgi:hypothetical protein
MASGSGQHDECPVLSDRAVPKLNQTDTGHRQQHHWYEDRLEHMAVAAPRQYLQPALWAKAAGEPLSQSHHNDGHQDYDQEPDNDVAGGSACHLASPQSRIFLLLE